MIDSLFQDIRAAVRHFHGARTFTLVVLVTLVLGVGANTAVYSLLSALILRTLPVRDPERLVAVSPADPRGPQTRLLYYTSFVELSRRQQSFDAVFAYSGGRGMTVEYNGVIEGGIGSEGTTPEYYEIVGVHPFLGRFLSKEDMRVISQPAPVVVVSHRLWQGLLGKDPGVIGRPINVEGTQLTVIGVLPPEFRGMQTEGGSDVFLPLPLIRWIGTTPVERQRPVRANCLIGRLRPGVTLRRARAEFTALWPAVRAASVPPGLTPAEREEMKTLGLRVEPAGTGFSLLRPRFAEPVIVLMWLSGVLLAIACVNLGGLFLARAASRQHEFAIRLSLGATRGRLVQQILLETLLLSGMGTLVALPLAWWTSGALGGMLFLDRGQAGVSMTPDTHVLGMTAAIAVATGLLLGILPSWIGSRRSRLGLLPGRTIVGTTGRWGKILLVAQIAISLVLLVGAGLFTQSLRNVQSIDSGFSKNRADRILWSRLRSQPGGYENLNAASYYPELVRRISGIPGVEAVSLARLFPSALYLSLTTRPAARSGAPEGTGETAAASEGISPGFFETVGVPLLQGRDFTWQDDGRHPAVAIINDSLRRRLFSSDSGIGEHIRFGTNPALASIEVVGVTGDLTIGNIREPHLPMIFRPMLQDSWRYPVVNLRVSRDAGPVSAPVSRAVTSLGHEFVLSSTLYTLEAQVKLATGQERILALLSSYAGGVAILMEIVGLYGLLSYSVARRTREIGIRMALGASRSRILRGILAEGLVLALLGVALGIPCALSGGRLVAGLLFGLNPADSVTFVAVGLFVVVLGAVAGLVPARRASGIEPMTALRSD